MLLRPIFRWLVLGAGMAGIAAFAGEDPVPAPSYELTDVTRKLLRELPAPEVSLSTGESIAAGDVLRTGSRSSADILCPEAMARFRLGAKTRARLSSDAPGVLLELERGRVHALFDKITASSRERLVVTPSAVLAVRGTEYGVEVDAGSNTTVVVFSGDVEIVDRGRVGTPVRVGPGQYTEVRWGEPAQPPIPHRMGPGDWDQGGRPEDVGPTEGRGSETRGFGGGTDGTGSGTGSGSMGSGSGGGGQGRGGRGGGGG